jgi:hypothetical protein
MFVIELSALSSRTTNAISTIIKAILLSGFKRLIRLIVACFDDLVNLARGLLVIKVMDLKFALACIGKVLLAIHMPTVTSRHFALLYIKRT